MERYSRGVANRSCRVIENESGGVNNLDCPTKRTGRNGVGLKRKRSTPPTHTNEKICVCAREVVSQEPRLPVRALYRVAHTGPRLNVGVCVAGMPMEVDERWTIASAPVPGPTVSDQRSVIHNPAADATVGRLGHVPDGPVLADSQRGTVAIADKGGQEGQWRVAGWQDGRTTGFGMCGNGFVFVRHVACFPPHCTLSACVGAQCPIATGQRPPRGSSLLAPTAVFQHYMSGTPPEAGPHPSSASTTHRRVN